MATKTKTTRLAGRVPDTAPTPAEAEREQAAIVAAQERQARKDGPDLQSETKLDADLAHLADDKPAPQTVRSVRRRRPHEIPVVLVGRHKGALHDAQIDLIVPDEDNAERVGDFDSVINPERDHEGKEKPLPGPDVVHMSGPSYHFIRGEATLVDAEDLPFFLAHKTWLFVRSDQQGGELVTDSQERRRAAQATRVRRTG